MAMLHDPQTRASIETRIQTLTPDAHGRWGKMTVDQMLWHCSQAIATSLGEIPTQPMTVPLPKAAVKFIVLNLPWVKGSPTAPDFLATTQYDFETERQRTLDLVSRFASRPLNSEWARHPAFGAMSGDEYSRLHAKHLNHHLTQFGV